MTQLTELQECSKGFLQLTTADVKAQLERQDKSKSIAELRSGVKEAETHLVNETQKQKSEQSEQRKVGQLQ